jgi:hypothetical protein
MSVYSEMVGNKGLFRRKVGQNHGLPPVFPLYQDEDGGAAACERMRSAHNNVPSGAGLR